MGHFDSQLLLCTRIFTALFSLNKRLKVLLKPSYTLTLFYFIFYSIQHPLPWILNLCIERTDLSVDVAEDSRCAVSVSGVSRS